MTEGSGAAVSSVSASGGRSAVPQGAGIALATVGVRQVVNLTGSLEVSAPTKTQPTKPERESRAVFAFMSKWVAAGILRELGERAAQIALPLFGLVSRNVKEQRPGDGEAAGPGSEGHTRGLVARVWPGLLVRTGRLRRHDALGLLAQA